MVSAPVRRLQVAYARSRELSQRRACALLSTSRSSLRYESRLEAREKLLLAAMTDLAATYPRFGYRRINAFMERQGHFMGADKAYPLVVQGWIAGAQKTASEADCGVPSATTTANGCKRTVGLRLCLRRLCKWSADQMPDRDG